MRYEPGTNGCFGASAARLLEQMLQVLDLGFEILEFGEALLVRALALLHLRSNDNAPDERGPDYIGLHHMGFLVDDVPEASEAVEAAGGTYHGQILNVGAGPESERKYRDPNGVVIDVTSPAHADSSWRVPTDS